MSRQFTYSRKRAIIYEARCARCGEIFNPADDSDLTHLVREDGQECGGSADPDTFGYWGIKSTGR